MTKKLIAIGTAVSLILGIVSTVLYQRFHDSVSLALAITFFTTFYHFAMRIFIASIVTLCRQKKEAVDFTPFKIDKAEKGFYERIRVKKWKRYAPTYNKKLFDFKTTSYPALMHHMVNAEIGHKWIVVFSFLPILLAKPLDGWTPFLITSVLAAVFDLQFVIIQRYNRARLSELLIKMNVLREG